MGALRSKTDGERYALVVARFNEAISKKLLDGAMGALAAHKLRSALTLKARDSQVRVLEDVTLEAPRTRRVAALTQSMGLKGRRVLLVVGAVEPNLFKSGRNIPGFTTKPVNSFSVHDVVGAEAVLLTRSALARLSEIWGAS